MLINSLNFTYTWFISYFLQFCFCLGNLISKLPKRFVLFCFIFFFFFVFLLQWQRILFRKKKKKNEPLLHTYFAFFTFSIQRQKRQDFGGFGIRTPKCNSILMLFYDTLCLFFLGLYVQTKAFCISMTKNALYFYGFFFSLFMRFIFLGKSIKQTTTTAATITTTNNIETKMAHTHAFFSPHVTLNVFLRNSSSFVAIHNFKY